MIGKTAATEVSYLVFSNVTSFTTQFANIVMCFKAFNVMIYGACLGCVAAYSWVMRRGKQPLSKQAIVYAFNIKTTNIWRRQGLWLCTQIILHVDIYNNILSLLYVLEVKD